MVNALVPTGEEEQAAKSLGELQASEEPGVSEWGNLMTQMVIVIT